MFLYYYYYFYYTIKNNFTKEKRMNIYGHISYIIIHVYEYLYVCTYLYIFCVQIFYQELKKIYLNILQKL